MTVLATLRRTFDSFVSVTNGSAYPYDTHVRTRTEPNELPQAELYRVLRLMYLSNGLYDDLSRANVALGRASAHVKAIRNPVPPVINFWGAKLWPNPLTIMTEAPAIVDPIEQVWRWSNWRAKQPMFARWTALYGEAFVKVRADAERGRVWFEYLEPQYVTDFEEDARGFLTWIRIDVPKTTEDAAGMLQRRTHTEVWSTDEQSYRRWESDGDVSRSTIRDLGPPDEIADLSAFGIDFVPFVRTPFSEMGDKRGIGAVQLSIEAIVEADLSATNLHAMLYQDADGAWVLRSVGVDGAGRPLPPPIVGQASADGIAGRQSDNTVLVGKRSFWRLPGNQELQSVVADINYDAALAILKDHDEQLERLMPALAYARISELSGSDLSGRAIRFKLTPAIDQVEEVRATALEKLAQADAMALTLGKAYGIAGFGDVGDFDAGDFEHGFEERDVIPISDLEERQGDLAAGQAAQAWQAAGLPLAEILQRAGYTEEEATRVVRLATADADLLMDEQEEDDEDDDAAP